MQQMDEINDLPSRGYLLTATGENTGINRVNQYEAPQKGEPLVHTNQEGEKQQKNQKAQECLVCQKTVGTSDQNCRHA